MNAPSHADIIDKIQKLRILAHNRSAMRGEVEAALHAVSSLMARYRISEAELEDAAAKHEVTESDDLWPPAKRQPPKWRLLLLSAISRPNGVVINLCTYPKKTIGVRLVGAERDVAIVKSLWAWLEAEAIRLSWGPLAGRPKSSKRPNRARLSKPQTDWIIGFAIGVAEQIERELRKDAETAGGAFSEPSQAMVLIDARVTEAKAWLARCEDTKPVAFIDGTKTGAVAFDRGFAAGERYHLGKKLSKENPS